MIENKHRIQNLGHRITMAKAFNAAYHAFPYILSPMSYVLYWGGNFRLSAISFKCFTKYESYEFTNKTIFQTFVYSYPLFVFRKAFKRMSLLSGPRPIYDSSLCINQKSKIKNQKPLCLLFPILIVLFFSSCDDSIKGCMDPNSSNYNPNAQKSDGSCNYPSNTKRNVCFYFTDSDDNTCGTFGIPLLDQVKAANSPNTFFISVHPYSTDTLFAPSGIDVASAYTISGFPNFGVGEQANLLTQSLILNAIQSESIETPQGGIDLSYTTTIDSIIVTIYGKFFTSDTSTYFVAAYVVEDNIVSPQIGISSNYNHQDILRATSGYSGIGQQINTIPVSSSTSFKIRSGIARNPVWNLSNITLIGVLWRKNGSDFEYINAGD